MIQLFLSWLLGKTLKLDLNYCMGKFIVTQIMVEMGYRDSCKVIIELEEKEKFKLKEYWPDKI